MQHAVTVAADGDKVTAKVNLLAASARLERNAVVNLYVSLTMGSIALSK